MHALETIKKINEEFSALPGRGDDTVDSWNPANYADHPDLGAPEWGCGIQPWSRGPAGSNRPITERDWRSRNKKIAEAYSLLFWEVLAASTM